MTDLEFAIPRDFALRTIAALHRDAIREVYDAALAEEAQAMMVPTADLVLLLAQAETLAEHLGVHAPEVQVDTSEWFGLPDPFDPKMIATGNE